MVPAEDIGLYIAVTAGGVMAETTVLQSQADGVNVFVDAASAAASTAARGFWVGRILAWAPSLLSPPVPVEEGTLPKPNSSKVGFRDTLQ